MNDFIFEQDLEKSHATKTVNNWLDENVPNYQLPVIPQIFLFVQMKNSRIWMPSKFGDFGTYCQIMKHLVFRRNCGPETILYKQISLEYGSRTSKRKQVQSLKSVMICLLTFRKSTDSNEKLNCTNTILLLL